jgi:hypothetical protein
MEAVLELSGVPQVFIDDFPVALLELLHLLAVLSLEPTARTRRWERG